MKRILTIDGGGVRGIIPAMVLGRLEKELGRPISEVFDLIAGTSTGAMLALGLCKDDGAGKPQFSARNLIEIYHQRGPDIFRHSAWEASHNLDSHTDEPYSTVGLNQVLEDYFAEEPLGRALTNVMVTSYELEERRPYMFKSWRPEWASIPMRACALATTAAPTYFEPALVRAEGKERALVDGGVFVNNPGMSAYAEARRLWSDSHEDDFVLVSLGTGEMVRAIRYEEAKEWGRLSWLQPVMSMMYDGQSDAADYQLKHLLGADRFFRFQIPLDSASDDMDETSTANIEALMREAKRLLRNQISDLDRLLACLRD